MSSGRRGYFKPSLPRRFLALKGAIFEAGNAFEECQRHGADRTVSLFGNDKLGFAFQLLSLLIVVEVIFLAPEKSDEVSILLDRARLSQIAQARFALAIAGARLRVAIKLSQHHDRNAQLLGESLNPGGNLRHFDLTVIQSPPTGRAKKLKIIDDN